MNRPKTMSVEHIEGGTFVGGDEDASIFGAREGGPFSVMRDEDIGLMMAEIDGLRELLREVIEGSVDATTYPDGPCLDRSLRAQIKRVLES